MNKNKNVSKFNNSWKNNLWSVLFKNNRNLWILICDFILYLLTWLLSRLKEREKRQPFILGESLDRKGQVSHNNDNDDDDADNNADNADNDDDNGDDDGDEITGTNRKTFGHFKK